MGRHCIKVYQLNGEQTENIFMNVHDENGVLGVWTTTFGSRTCLFLRSNELWFVQFANQSAYDEFVERFKGIALNIIYDSHNPVPAGKEKT